MSFKKTVMTCAAGLLLASLFSGCAYRSDLAQGNFVEQDAVNQLTYGMTQEQVRFVMGTPMLIDPFDSSRWYYVHFLREGWSDPEIKNMVLLFSGKVLVDISGDFQKPATFGSGQSLTPTFNEADLATDGDN